MKHTQPPQSPGPSACMEKRELRHYACSHLICQFFVSKFDMISWSLINTILNPMTILSRSMVIENDLKQEAIDARSLPSFSPQRKNKRELSLVGIVRFQDSGNNNWVFNFSHNFFFLQSFWGLVRFLMMERKCRTNMSWMTKHLSYN